MKKVLLSFVMVFTVAFAMAINPEDIVFNGGTVDFSKDTIYVAVCSGDKLNVYIENYGADYYGFNSSDENAPVLYYTEDDATISSVNTLVTEESIGYTYLVTDDLGRQIKVLVLGVMLPTVTPQITTEAENFSVGNKYVFTATINADELEGWWFDWSVTPQDGCIVQCIHCDDPETMVTINKSGTYILKCVVSNENTTYGPCGGVATMEITVPNPTITYTYDAAPSYCENGYSQLNFTVKGTNVSELTGTYVMDFISPTRESIVGHKRDDNERSFNILELSKAAPTTYYTSIKDGNGTEIANPVITIKPSPKVTCSSSTFYQDQEYVFINENYNSEDSYRWDIHGLGEYSIVNNREESITVKFLETGDYQVSCKNQSNGCSGYYDYLTVSTAPTPSIYYTYDATASNCLGQSAAYVIRAPNESTLPNYTGYVMEFISPAHESLQSTSFSVNAVYFDMDQFEEPGVYQTIIKDPDGVEIGRPVITIKDIPTKPSITYSSTKFFVNQEYEFVNENNSEISNHWYVSNVSGHGEYSFIGDRDESSVIIKFLNAGDYEVECYASSNGCGNAERINIIVEESPVCSISGTPYSTLAEALSSIQEGETVVLNSNCSEEGAYANTSFSLDLNGYEATLQSLIVDEALTVTNGTLTTALWGHGASGTLTVDGATINTVPNPTDYMDGHKTFKWKGNIELANNGVLEVQDSAYFGGDEGFTLSIDKTSSMNLNNAIIAIPDMDADTATTLNQIRQYLPDGYTVNASENYNWDADGYLLEFSPDANVVLQAQPDPITFTVQNSLQYDETNNKHLLIGCAGVTNQLVITASEDVPTNVTYYISGGYGDVLIPAEVDGNTLTFTMYSSGSRLIQLEYSDTDHYLHVIPLEDINQLYYVVTGVNTPEITQPTSSYVTGKDYVFQVVSPNELLNYTWEVIDGDNNQTEYEGASATISFATVGDYTIKCVATDSEIGCESGVNPITITVLEPVTYTTQPQFFCDSWWGATYDYNVTASRALTESDVILVVGEKSFRGTPSGTQITFPLQYLEAGTYDVTLLDADSTDILIESSVTIYAPSVQEPLDDDADYELNVAYTYTVTNPVEGHEYTWEITYYGGDSNSAADAEDYVMETNDTKTTMTVTFLHSADFRVEFMDETCGIGGDMAAYVPKSYTAESQTFYASDAEYQYSVVASEKFWGNYDEFILVVDDKSYHAFGKDGTFSIDFTLSGLEAGTYDNVVMFDADSANVLAGPTTISILPVVCNNTTRTFSYNENSNNYTYTLESVTTNADAGDVFTVVWEGTPDFSGQLGFALIDRSEEANWWRIVSDWTSVTVERGVPFSMSATLVVADSVSSASEIAFFSTIEGKVGQPTICETEFSFTQNCHNIALVGSLSVPLAYVDGSVAKNDVYYYNVKGHSDFAGEVMLSLVDQSEEAGWWDMLTDGQVVTVQKDADFEFEGYFVADKATSSTTPDVRFVINRTVDATVTDTTNLCISESSFSQYGADFACASEKIIFNGTNGKAVASLSEVAVGDVYECSIEGTADFTGEMYIALVDHSEEVDWWLELAQSTAIQVAEGEQFEYSGTFTVETQTTSTTPEFLLMIGHGDAETGSISQVCITNASIRKPTVYTVSDITLCEAQTIASVSITAEPAAIFEVVSETGAVIQSFSSETSEANFNISDLTAGTYTYYIKENDAVKETFNITVYANPTVEVSTSPAVICAGDEVSFIANATGNDLTYQWNTALEIEDATLATAKWQSTDAGQYPISCTVTGKGGCPATEQLTVLVYPVPSVKIDGSEEVTAGDEVTYTAAVTYEGESYFAYNWSGAAQGEDQTLTTTFTDEGVSKLYCEVVTREGCKNSDTLEVTVSEPPFVCDNDEITLAYSGEASISGMYGYTYLYENVITTAAEGDTFVMEWKGTSNFTGEMNICLIDRSEEAGYWSEISNWESIYVEKDVPFSVIKTFTINGTLSSEPEFGLAATVVLEKQRESVTLCQTDFSFAKEEFVKVFEMYYNEYGENWQRHYPETQTEVLQAVYEATGENEYVPVMEDVFMLTITGKANYTGSLDFYIVDERQEVEYWQELTSSQGIFVREGEYFSVQVPLTVTQTLYNKIRLSQAGLQINAKPIDGISNLQTTDIATISLTEYSFTFIPSGGQLEVLKTITLNYDEYASDEDGDGISDSWRRDSGINISEFGTLITEKTGLYSYYFGTQFDHEYYTPKVGDKLTYSMKGTADFTGRMSCALIDESAEVCYYAEFSSYNETYVNEGEPFVFEGELVITNVETICEDNPARMMNPEFHISIFPSVTSTNAEFDNTKEYTLSLTDYTLDFIVDDYECDGTHLMFGSAESLNSLQKSIADEITEETTFNLSWAGTPNFTGLVQAVVIDASEEFNGMVLSQPIVEIEVEANKAFTVNQDVVVSASKSSKPNYVIEIFVPYQAEGFKATAPTVDICETEFSFVKVEQQPVSVSFSQSLYEISAGGSELICLVTEGIDLSKATITYNVSSNLSVKDKNEGCVIVTDQNGVASTQQIEAVVIYNNKEYTATADIQIIEEQPNCEGTFVTFTSAEETYGGTTYYFYESSHDVEIYNASEDDTFEFEWSFTPNFSANSVSVALVDLSNNNSSSATIYFTEGSNRTQVFNFSLPDGNNEKSTYAIKTTIQSNEKIENATLCESYFSFKKVEKPLYAKEFVTEYNYYGTDTDGDGVSDGWQSGFDEFPTAVYEATGNTGWSPAIGDVFSLSMQGVANFTGTVNFFMVDQREAAGYWGIASEHVPGFYVAEGEPFNITDYFAVTSTGNDDVTYAPNFVVLCQPDVTSTSAGFSEFVTYKLSLTNYGLSFYPSTATGTCDGNLITTLNAGLIDVSHYVDNAIVEGDKVTVNWSATPDFTGELSVALVDGRNTAEDAWLFMTDPITFEVTKDVAFEVSMPFDVTDTHIKPFYQMYVAVNDLEGTANVYNICSSEITVTIKKHEELPNYVKVIEVPYDEWGDDYDGDNISDNWREGISAYESLGVDTYVPVLGDHVEYSMKGIANFTGKVSLGLIDEREAACYYAEFSDYNSIYVVEGEEFEFEGTLVVSNIQTTCNDKAVELMNPMLNVACLPNVKSTNADFSTEKIYSLSLTDYSLEYVQKQPSDCMLEITMENSNSVPLAHVYENIAVGDEYYAHVTGVADFTGEVFFAFIDNSEEANWWYMLDNETKGLSVVEGDTLNFEGYFTVSNPVLTSKPDIAFMVGLVDSEGLGKVANICVSSVEFVKQENTFTCEGDKLILNGAEGGALATFDEVSLGDVYTCNVEGVTDFTDEVYIALVDHSEEAGWWSEMAEPLAFNVVAGEPFVYEGTFTVTEQTKSTAPEYVVYIGHSKAEGGPISRFCITKSQIEKRDVVFTLSETEVSMIVGDKKQLAVVVSESEYPFEVTWNSTNSDVVSVENGLVSALAEGTAEVQVLVNNKVVASASVIVNCENYWVRFDNKNYEITEGDSISACLSFGECFNHVDPQFEFNPNVISLTEPSDKQSTCGTITGLMAGQTSVIVSAYANGTTYTDTAIVVVKMKANKETLISLIDEGNGIQEKVLEGTYVISPIVYNEFQETMQNANEVRDNNKATQDEVDAVANSLYVAIDAIKLIAAHQMPDPVLTTEEITVCHNRTGDAISLAEFAQTTTVNGKLQWFDESGNILESTPEIDFKTIGKLTYYVTQIGTGATAECLPSDTLPLTINIVYVAAPEMNVYEQKLCNGEELQPFVAKTTNNVVWFNADSVMVAEGNSFTPSATGTYYAYTKESVDGCVSEATIVTYMLGRKTIPTVVMKDSKTEFAVGEPIEMAAQNIDADVFSIVWTVDGITMQGEEFSISTLSEGAHTIICREIDMASGCYDSTMVEIEVKNLVVPVTAISVEPSDMELYTNEKGHLTVSFEPSHATNQRYVVTVADTSVAVVSGATVIPVGAGETTLTVSSAENGDISASVSVKVTEYVAARSISVPKILTMAVGESTKISASVLPSNASKNKVYFMEKSDSSVVKVSADGTVVARGEGTAVVNSYTEGGLQAVTVVYVTSNAEEITSIEVPERVAMKVGDSVSVPVKVTPTSLLIKDLEWTIEDNSVASYNDGVLKALKKGETTLSVSYKGITETVAIVVNASSAPSVTTVPQVVMNQDGTATVDLSMYVTDEGGFENLTVTPSSEDFTVTVEDGKITIRPVDPSYVGTDTVSVVVTNGEGLSAEVEVPVTVQETEDKAPVVKLHEILLKEDDTFKYIDLSDIAEDDLTDWSGLKFTFSIPRNGANNQQTITAKIMKKTQLRVVKMLPFEQDTMFVTVSDGVNTTLDTIIVYVGSIPNKAPVIAEIPVQNETDEVLFGTIDLTKYVTDDYTTPAAITWTTSASENISVTVANGVAGVTVLNEFWRGAEAIKFYAKDEEGAMDSTVVYYVRNVTIKTEPEVSPEQGSEIVAIWEGAPSFDIMAMRTVGVPGDSYVLMASLFGFNGSFEWTIEGAEGVSAGLLMQTVTFAEPGEYDVTLTIMSADGKYEKSLTKEKLLKVVGIDKRAPEICKGQAVTLNATAGMDSYYWTSGDAKESAMVRPGETTTVAVTMKQGLFTFVDSVRVKVSVPVSLMEDSVMCKGTTFDLEAQGEYVSYTWNTGESTKSIALPDVVATYSVMTVDDMQCVSADTFNLTKVNELPAIDLGEDQTPCDGTTVTLDAGAGYDYLWKNGSTAQTIDLTAGTDTVWARIIDDNLCVNYDTVVVAFTYPYPEQLGVATASETTDHVILAWEKTAGVNTQSYVIERETYETDRWDPVGDTVDFTQPGLVVDEWVNSKQTAYKYRLVTIDGCGNKAISEVHRTMHSMRVPDPETGLMQIRWTGYEPIRQQDGTATIKQYIILRGTEGNMDSVGFIPASSNEYIWTETDASMTDLKTIKYRVAFRLSHPVNENAVNTLDGQPVEGYYTKAESGPFSLALSNIAELENLTVEEVPFADVVVYPTTFSSFINVAISADMETNFMVEVVNANGQVVARTQTGEINKTLLQIPADNFRQGVYTVKISDGQQVKTIKVVK